MSNPTRYQFATTSGNPCDRCDVLEGEHDTPPHVPVHPFCECVVQPTTPREPEPEMDFLEVRNVEVMETDYVESFPLAEFTGAPEDREFALTLDLGMHEQSLDEPLTVDDLDVDEPSGTETETVMLPAEHSGRVSQNIRMLVYIVRAELWRVYTVTTPDVALVEEELVDTIGGFVKYRAGLDSLELDATPDAPPDDDADDGDNEGGGGYFEEGDGVPS